MCIPTVSYDDPRGSWRILLTVVLFCLLVLGLTGWLVHGARADAERRDRFLAGMPTATPTKDAGQAIRSGDTRLLALPALQTGARGEEPGRLNVPGLGELDRDQARTVHYRLIPGVIGLIFENRQEQEYRQAEAYAQAYNEVVLAERGRGKP